MKHYIRFLLPAVLALLISVVSFANDTQTAPPASIKIGVLDWQLLSSKAPQAQEASKRLEKEFQGRKDTFISKQKEFQSSQEKLQKDKDVMSEAERGKLEKNLTKMQQDLRHMDEELRSDYTARYREEMDNFINVVREVVDKLAQEEKYDLVIPQETTLFMADRIDMTEKVLDRLKKAKPTTKTEEKTKK